MREVVYSFPHIKGDKLATPPPDDPQIWPPQPPAYGTGSFTFSGPAARGTKAWWDRKPWWRKKRWIAAGAIVALGVIGAATGGGHSKKSPTGATAPSVEPSLAPTVEEPSSDVPTTESASDSQLDAFIAWRDGGGTDHLNTLSSDLKSTGTDATALDYDALTDDCTTLQSDVEATQEYGPIPVSSIETPFAKALAYFARAAGDCLSGVSTFDATVLQKCADELGTGNSYLEDSTSAVDAFTGSS